MTLFIPAPRAAFGRQLVCEKKNQGNPPWKMIHGKSLAKPKDAHKFPRSYKWPLTCRELAASETLEILAAIA